jgi:hypothetical protein
MLNVYGFSLNYSLSIIFSFFFLSMIYQDAFVTTGRRGNGSVADHFKAGWVSEGT